VFTKTYQATHPDMMADVRNEQLTPESVHLDAGAEAVAEACAVAVSPDGAHVYVAGYGHNAIALFRRGGP